MTKATAQGSTINLVTVQTISQETLQKIENNQKAVKGLEEDLSIATNIEKTNGGIVLSVGMSTQDEISDIEEAVSKLKAAAATFIEAVEALPNEEKESDNTKVAAVREMMKKLNALVPEAKAKGVGFCAFVTGGESCAYLGCLEPIVLAHHLLKVQREMEEAHQLSQIKNEMDEAQ